MDKAIALDSSAVLALIQSEMGGAKVAGAMIDGTELLVSSVNLCEVGTRLVLDGYTSEEVGLSLNPFLSYVVGFDSEQARYAAELARVSKGLGLSLGDRACLALAAERGAKVWTADRVWMKLEVGLEIELIR